MMNKKSLLLAASVLAFSIAVFTGCSNTGGVAGGDTPATGSAVSYTHSPSPRDRQKSRMPSSA